MGAVQAAGNVHLILRTPVRRVLRFERFDGHGLTLQAELAAATSGASCWCQAQLPSLPWAGLHASAPCRQGKFLLLPDASTIRQQAAVGTVGCGGAAAAEAAEAARKQASPRCLSCSRQ